MEGRRFDALIRSLADGGTRRGLLRVLGGLPLGGLLAMTREQPETEAHGRKSHHHRHEAHSAACIPTGQRCPAKKPRGKQGKRLGCAQCCQDLVVTDAGGTRVCGCLPNGRSCGDATACCSGICLDGICQAAPCSVAGACSCDGTSCAGCCAGTGCVALAAQTDTQCGTGTPGAACTACSGATPVCVSGRCQPCSVADPCSGGLVCCSGSCTDTDTDETNCGSCGNVCSGATPVCLNGSCVD